MYDDRQKWNNFGSMSGQKAVECLLDFSRGPGSMLVADFKNSKECNSIDGTSDFSNFKMESISTLERDKFTTVEASVNRTRKTDGKPRAVCSFCGKEFSHLGDHNKHRRRHTGERPYGCDLCPLRFAHASNLARHRRLHSGEKPFSCTGCGRGFARKDKLNAHMARRRCSASPSIKPDGETSAVGPAED